MISNCATDVPFFDVFVVLILEFVDARFVQDTVRLISERGLDTAG